MPALLDLGGQVPLVPATALSTARCSLTSGQPPQAAHTTPRFGLVPDDTQEAHYQVQQDGISDANDNSHPTSIIIPDSSTVIEHTTTSSIHNCAKSISWATRFQLTVETKACTWFGICDFRLKSFEWTWSWPASTSQERVKDEEESMTSDYWESGTSNPKHWSKEENKTREIPQYVLDYAPYIHLYSGESYWPCDIADHLIHTTPHLNYTPIQSESDHPSLTNLSNLNRWGRFVYLKSDDNVEDYPDWLGGEQNIPTLPKESSDEANFEQSWEEWGDADLEGFDSDEDILRWFNAHEQDFNEKATDMAHDGTSRVTTHDQDDGDKTRKPTRSQGKVAVGGRSGAPAVLVVVPKPNGIVDAFWFFFYSYNLGNTVFNVRFGNHVGDWEHTLVRFHNGKPKAVFYSEHNFGAAYTYDAVEKIGKRPVGYSAIGTHAMYARAGEHPYVLPNGILKDRTDRGPLWDPALNLHAFTYNYFNDTLRASTQTPNAPLDWFYFNGRWGDKIYPITDPRQYAFLGQYHYVTGPSGPRFKNLGRRTVCQGNDKCVIKNWISGKEVRKWRGEGESEDMSETDACLLYPEECQT